ncbi:hypothetical protein ABZ807_17830 [Micromonospora sp. NPDC047548]|uniref:hypothetical protein n=1 Tax=Micromonospora sp. NPDC047548 TaxID=3155624 RepID=UPI0033D7C265
MATTTLTHDRVHIRFTSGERLWTRRERLSVPLTAVREASHAPEPLRLPRGARSGIAISGFLKIGTWGIFGGPRQLVSARRGQPGLHLLVDRAAAAGYDEIVLSDPAAPTLVESIRQIIRSHR